jgi:hypothetical protein
MKISFNTFPDWLIIGFSFNKTPVANFYLCDMRIDIFWARAWLAKLLPILKINFTIPWDPFN